MRAFSSCPTSIDMDHIYKRAEEAQSRVQAQEILDEFAQRERFLQNTRESRIETAQRLLRLCR